MTTPAFAATLLPQALASLAVAEDLIIGQASVIDGDTIEIHGTRIRLHGMDARRAGRPARTPKAPSTLRAEDSQCGGFSDQ